MTVRLKLALTIVATGLLTALLVIATVLYAFQRFEREMTYQRAHGFLERITMTFDNLLELNERRPEEVRTWLRSLLLYEPDSQLYLLDAQGRVLSGTPQTRPPSGFRVAMGPVREAARGASGAAAMPYVLGNDPERMTHDAVIAARELRRTLIRADEPVSGYLYLVCHQRDLPGSYWMALRSTFALPALLLIAAIVALTTGLAAFIISSVTRPLQRLTGAVAGFTLDGLEAGSEPGATGKPLDLPPRTADEFGRLGAAFEMLLGTLRKQWEALRRLDHFRREGVSNLSHDLRSPLTATVACLETLESRWAAPAHPDDRRLVEVALRNTRNAARLVQSLGELAKLDEPGFALRREVVPVRELLDDIVLRFAPRAKHQGIELDVHGQDRHPASAPFAALDVELFERAVANLIDNALKFGPAGSRVWLQARRSADKVFVSVSDNGPGIAAADQEHLFDRFYQSRTSAAPATGEGGKGLGLAIVKRIAELHGGAVTLTSELGAGTEVVITLGAAHPGANPP